MESQPQNPEFRNNPENFHPCKRSYMDMFMRLWYLSCIHIHSFKICAAT